MRGRASSFAAAVVMGSLVIGLTSLVPTSLSVASSNTVSPICITAKRCVFGGVMNRTLGAAAMAVSPSGGLLVSGIGSSGRDGFAQDSLPPETREVRTVLLAQGRQAALGARQVVKWRANVPGGVFATLTVEGLGDSTEVLPDLSTIGTTLYTLTVLDGSQVSRVLHDVPKATFRTGECVGAEFSCNADGSISYRLKYPKQVFIAAVAAMAFGDCVEIRAQDAVPGPSTVLASVEYLFKDVGPIEISSEVIGPRPIQTSPARNLRLWLHPPTPNPTTGMATVTLEMVTPGPVSAQILSVDGRLVRRLASSEWFGPGPKPLRWDGRSEARTPLPSGTYFLVVRAAGETIVRAIALRR